jgi:hypothetical protein
MLHVVTDSVSARIEGGNQALWSQVKKPANLEDRQNGKGVSSIRENQGKWAEKKINTKCGGRTRVLLKRY